MSDNPYYEPANAMLDAQTAYQQRMSQSGNTAALPSFLMDDLHKSATALYATVHPDIYPTLPDMMRPLPGILIEHTVNKLNDFRQQLIGQHNDAEVNAMLPLFQAMNPLLDILNKEQQPAQNAHINGDQLQKALEAIRKESYSLRDNYTELSAKPWIPE